MIYIIIIILLGLYTYYRIELSKKRKESDSKLKYTRDVEYIIRVIKSCVTYKQLVSLNKWWRTYLNNSGMFTKDYFRTVEDRYRIERIIQNKLHEIQDKVASKLNQDQLDILHKSVENRESYIRKGQAYFLELNKINPTLADLICSTEDDPFYDDSRIEKFLNKISE